MNIIVRDVVMPDCCKNCACSAGYGCEITSTIMTTKEMESRPDWCPLEEVESCEDAVSRQAAIDAVENCEPGEELFVIKSLPSARPEITEEDVKEYCKKRCLIVVTSEFYDEMIKRWSYVQPEQQSFSCGHENDPISRQAAIDVVHKIIYGFFDLVDDDSEEPTSDKDKLLLEVNKSICNGIKDLVSAQPEREGRKDDEQIRGFGL